MHISISNTTMKYMSILSIDKFPFSEETLKTNFRTLAKQCHPDTSDNGSKQFIKIKEAYDALINLASLVTPEDVNNELRKQEESKDDMFELYDTCSNCKGVGTTVEQQLKKDTQSYRKAPCILCPPKLCPDCVRGTFTLRSGRKVACKKCHGFGILPNKKCSWCGGMGTLKYNYETESVTVKCSTCSGTGKIKIDPFNPVISKRGIMI